MTTTQRFFNADGSVGSMCIFATCELYPAVRSVQGSDKGRRRPHHVVAYQATTADQWMADNAVELTATIERDRVAHERRLAKADLWRGTSESPNWRAAWLTRQMLVQQFTARTWDMAVLRAGSSSVPVQREVVFLSKLGRRNPDVRHHLLELSEIGIQLDVGGRVRLVCELLTNDHTFEDATQAATLLSV